MSAETCFLTVLSHFLCGFIHQLMNYLILWQQRLNNVKGRSDKDHCPIQRTYLEREGKVQLKTRISNGKQEHVSKMQHQPDLSTQAPVKCFHNIASSKIECQVMLKCQTCVSSSHLCRWRRAWRIITDVSCRKKKSWQIGLMPAHRSTQNLVTGYG